jgi:hypothetical protein
MADTKDLKSFASQHAGSSPAARTRASSRTALSSRRRFCYVKAVVSHIRYVAACFRIKVGLDAFYGEGRATKRRSCGFSNCAQFAATFLLRKSRRLSHPLRRGVHSLFIVAQRSIRSLCSVKAPIFGALAALRLCPQDTRFPQMPLASRLALIRRYENRTGNEKSKVRFFELRLVRGAVLH